MLDQSQVNKDNFSHFLDSLFDYPCKLHYLPPDLELRHGHSLLSPLPHLLEYPADTQLVARCKDQTAAMEGSAVMSCKDGVWDHPLPRCRKTYDREEFDGEN